MPEIDSKTEDDAEDEFDTGMFFHRKSEYPEAVEHLTASAELYNGLSRRAESPQKRLYYLQKERDCLQKIQIDSFMPDFTRNYGLSHWIAAVRQKTEVERKISALEAELTESLPDNQPAQ